MLSSNRVRTVCKGKREKIVRDTKATYSNSDGSLMQRWAKYFKGQGEPLLEFKSLTLWQHKILSTMPNFNKVCYTHKQRLWAGRYLSSTIWVNVVGNRNSNLRHEDHLQSERIQWKQELKIRVTINTRVPRNMVNSGWRNQSSHKLQDDALSQNFKGKDSSRLTNRWY